MPLIEIRDINKFYGKVQVLRNISLNVEEGEIVALIGPSGSGKSTLLRCINGLETIQQGTVTVAGRDVRPDMKDLLEMRREVGIVFQAYNLFPHLTVEKNITLAPVLTRRVSKADARALALECLTKVGLAEKISAYPAQLSGGQQQRVAIARCLAMKPQLMLFDEVTSALDPELVAEVLKVMSDMAAQGMTMVLVTHEMQFARNVADKVVFMREGRIWEQGPAKEIFSNPQTPELRAFLGKMNHE